MDAKKTARPSRFRCSSEIALDFIKKFSIKPGQKIVIVCRVSTRGQKSHLGESEAYLRKQVKRAGGVVVAVVARSISGFDPWWLARAAVIAKKHNAVLLAESTDRFVRHPAYHSVSNPLAQARQCDLVQLRQYTDGVPLMTILDPDAPPHVVRRHQTQRGQKAKGKYRRPSKNPGYKKRRKENLFPQVLKLRSVGLTERAIGQKLGISSSTIHDWLTR